MSPLSRKVQAQKILSVNRLRHLAQWNKYTSKVLTRGASALAFTLISDNENDNNNKVYESIYIPRVSPRDWECERRHRRIFERDFLRYNHELQYRDLDELSNLDSEAWNLIKVSQENYVSNTSSDSDVLFTLKFLTNESKLEDCSDIDLFKYTIISYEL